MANNPVEAESEGLKGLGKGTKILVGVIIAIVLIALVAVFTLTIAVMETDAGGQFPYVTTYRVTLPDGEPVSIGNTRISVMAYENEVVTDVDGTKEKLVVGQQRVISPHKARVVALGVPVMDTDFQIVLTYRGQTGKNANFDLTLKTSQQVPEVLLRRLLPQNMNAQPV
ncbi:MAG: hypothetical protein STSR0009_09990 [Methanoregula sp.]